jgi:hypothetical protein
MRETAWSRSDASEAVKKKKRTDETKRGNERNDKTRTNRQNRFRNKGMTKQHTKEKEVGIDPLVPGTFILLQDFG